MVKFLNEPFSEWLNKNKPRKSIIIISKYIKKREVDSIIKLFKPYIHNSSVNLTIIFEDKFEHFLLGKSDFISLDIFSFIGNIEFKTVRVVDYNSIIIDGNSILLLNGTSINNIYNNSITEPIVISNVNDVFKDDKFISAKTNNNVYRELIKELNSIMNSTKDNYYLYSILLNDLDKLEINSQVIPQFSSFDDGTYNVVNILMHCGNYGVTFDKLGFYLTEPGKKNQAYKKYGENHAKFSELLELAFITNERPRKVYLTKLGEAFYSWKQYQKKQFLVWQLMKLDIIKSIIKKCHTQESCNICNYLSMYLSPKTAKRRASNIKNIISFLSSYDIDIVKSINEKII